MILSLPQCGLGDALALTAAVRELHKDKPDESVAVLPNPFPDVFLGNPHFVPVASTDMRNVRFLEVERDGLIGNIALSFGIQIGANVQDTTPEIHGIPPVTLYGKKTIALDIHSRAASRRWTFERWTETVSILKACGWDVVGVGCRVPDHDATKEADQRLVPGLVEDWTNRLSIRETAEVIKGADLFLGMDSGLAHLAAAVGTPQVVLYSRSPWYSRAYWNTTPVFHPATCPVACGRECVNPVASCLSRVSPDSVVRAVYLAESRFPKARRLG